MKLNNFTSLDPEEQKRGIKGLVGASALDRKVWNEFHASADAVEESEALWQLRVDKESPSPAAREPAPFFGVTEAMAARKIRLGHRYFRRVVLANFDHRCALTGISQPDLLTASHISPWSEDAPNRVEVANGLCLNRLHDAAFDRKLITFDDELRLVVGRRIREALTSGALADGFLSYEGKRLAEPVRRPLSLQLVRNHRKAFMDAGN